MKHVRRPWGTLVISLIIVGAALLIAACGSGSGSGAGGVSGGGVTVAGLKQTGPGLTEPTTGSGTRVRGGTVTFAEAPSAPPNYIFPMYSVAYCGSNNIDDLSSLLYKPLYTYGNRYSPTIDYNDSIGQKPVFSDGGRTVTIHLNHYMWSDGVPVTARNMVFWINLMKADPAKEWCGYIGGRFPDNVTSYRALNASTLQLTFNRAYNPTWLLYNQLSQIYTLPMAWDRTSLSQPAPNPNAADLPDTTRAGALKVYAFLNAQSLKVSDWASSPLWSVVNGPWRVQSTSSTGEITFVPNRAYSGPQKPSISRFVEVPFTSESAMINEIKAQGTDSLTIAYIPSQYQPLTASFKSEGYDVNMASTYGFTFFTLNFNNPTAGPVFRQLYFRQALQHLVDQSGWIEHFLHGAAVPSYGPMPLVPPSPLHAAAGTTVNPFPFSVTAASRLLAAHGWKVVPGGSTVCQRPGSESGECGAGITRGEQIAFTIDYESDVSSTAEEMEDLQSQAAKAGIKISLTTHPYDDVVASAQPCTSTMAACSWQAANDGSSWLYDYYPTGDELFTSTSIENVGGYNSPEMNRLIAETTTAPAARETAVMRQYSAYAERQLPVIYVPEGIGAFGSATGGVLISKHLGGFTPNTFGYLNPQDWYLTK